MAADFPKIAATSSTVAVFRAGIGSTTSLLIITGAGEAAVDARIKSIFFERNWAKSSVVKLEVDTDAGFSSCFNFDHRALWSSWHALMVANQWVLSSCW